jgi:hypothetical protein
MLFGRDLTVIVQKVDIGYEEMADLPTAPLPQAGGEREDVWVIVQKVDLGYQQMVDYDAAPRPADTVLVVEDDIEFLLKFDPVFDNIVVTDVFDAKLIVTLDFTYTLTATDAGVVSWYDYAGTDYFMTPLDYVGNREVF